MMPWTEAHRIVPVLCLATIVGAAAYSLVAPIPQTPLDELVGVKKTVIEGVVITDIDRREKVALVTMQVGDTKVLVSADPYTAVAYGDRITAQGTLTYPEPFNTDSGHVFDYPHHLRAHGILYTMSFAKTTLIREGVGNPVVAKLIDIKHLFERGIGIALPAPESSLLAGLLIGDKRSLGDEITDAFRASGIIHIIVLSGYNVALVLQAVVLICSRVLPRMWTYGVAAVFVIGFAVMTGASETTVRAVLMALLMMLATVLHRPKAALRVLLIAAAAMAVWNPFIVLYDLSFQLSILATLGLILFSHTIAARISLIPHAWGLRDVVATTLATQITVLPLLILSVGQVSLVFLATNSLVLPIVPAAMLMGFLSTVVALVSPTIALPIASGAYLILAYIIGVGKWFGDLPFSSIVIPPGWEMVMFPMLAIAYLAMFRFLKNSVS